MIYLDHAATSPLLPEVKNAMSNAMKQLFGNAASIHTPGHTAHELIEDARKKVARLINAKPSEIIFTSGASEGNNAVMHAFAGKNIMISPFEHPSVMKPAQRYGKQVTEITPHFTGHASRQPVVTGGARSFSVVTCERSLKNVSLISVQLANHEIGTVFPVKELAKQAHEHDTYFHTDATQAIGKIPVDVKKLDVDYLTFSAHKFGGPTGVGVLYVKNDAPFEPLILGGHQENSRRAGTHNTIGIIGLAAAADYIIKNNTPAIYEKKIRPLRDLLEKKILENINGSEVNSFLRDTRRDSPSSRVLRAYSRPWPAKSPFKKLLTSLPNITNISFRGAEGESIQLMLDHEGIIVSTGSACAATDGQPSPVLMALHGDAEIAHSSIRFSLGLDITKKDIDCVMQVLPAIIKKLQGISTV